MGTTCESKVTSDACAQVKQFDIMWANLPTPIGRRPVLLLTRTAAYSYLNKVLIAEVTSTVRSIPQEVRLGKGEGLSQASVVNFDNIHVIPKASLDQQIGSVSPARHVEIKRALGYVLDWPELKVL
jgi:mRNA interferase MazF